MLTNNEIQPQNFIKDEMGFNEFLQSVKNLSGVDLSQKRDITMQRIVIFAQNNNLKNFKDLVSIMRRECKLRQDIINLITVNETYFYRELVQLKEAINYAKQLGGARILCAPCSTGDEVYSLAMLSIENAINPSQINIVGIDIDSKAIEQCNLAQYSVRSLQRLSMVQKERFFSMCGEKYCLKKQMLPRCEFKVVNVFDHSLFALGKFDIILSRNMMIYFDDDYRLKCIERFHKLLNVGGRFYAGSADLVPSTPLYTKKFVSTTSYYEKV